MEAKAIETIYKAYRFRSRLEARWAVFLDACNVDWEYEPEGYEFTDGTRYLPDFLLHNVRIFSLTGLLEPMDLFLEVKGEMTDEDAEKIMNFYHAGKRIYVVHNIPECANIKNLAIDLYDQYCLFELYPFEYPKYFSTCTINGRNLWAYPMVTNTNQLIINEILMSAMDREAYGSIESPNRYRGLGHDNEMSYALTLKAFQTARQARFEYGERA